MQGAQAWITVLPAITPMPAFILYSFGKTRMMGLPDGEKSLTICIVYPFLTECTNVTDRQTDTQTDRRMDTA